MSCSLETTSEGTLVNLATSLIIGICVELPVQTRAFSLLKLLTKVLITLAAI